LTIEIIVKFKGRAWFQQYNPKKRKRYGIMLYKLCDSKGCTYDMIAYLGNQHVNAAENVTPEHGTVVKLIRKMEVIGHRLFLDNYFSLPEHF
jgi:hypothetical protein